MAGSFYSRVSRDAGNSAKAVMQMADRFRELGDTAMAGVADDVSQTLGRLAYDAMTTTQTISVPLKPDDEP